jgi:hypothetical protein
MQLNTTPVPNIVFDHYLKELKLAELKILLVIIRQTFGWTDNYTKSKRKEKDWISNNQLALKTGSSRRAINEAIQTLVQKNLIEVLSFSGDVLDVPEKRRGQQKLFYRPSSAIITHVENEGKKGLYQCLSNSANANFAGDLRKKVQELTQKMRITKETIQN